MDTRQALRQARQELDELGLADWGLVLDARPTRRLGQTRFSQRTIGLTRSFVQLNEWDVIRVTVRHEAAHALVGPGYGHGPVWKRKARELGVPTSYKLDDRRLVTPTGKVAIVCPTCGRVGARSRMPKAGMRYRHNACGAPVSFERVV